MVKNEFDIFNDAIGYCKWYSLPIEMQRMLIILMANAQRPTTIHGYGNILCTRIAFKKVKYRSKFLQMHLCFQQMVVYLFIFRQFTVAIHIL